MERRQFIQAAASTALLPSVLTLPAFSASLTGPYRYAFFDERFERARQVAAAWSESARLLAVHGDVTPFWTEALAREVREKSLTLRGVTTGSFHFCLGVLLSEHAFVDARVSRVDRNLLLWTMHSSPKN
jgi:hypothetical protein|nr:MAG: hypothetical protein DIU56_02665 [Pseudomonadota bacterium]